MVTFNTEAEKRITHRLKAERIIWLTTVDKQGIPQPRPVWFFWDGEAVIIYSRAKTGKVTHIANNPHVALTFNSDATGGDIAVIIGDATVSHADKLDDAYIEKYAMDIKRLGETNESFVSKYSAVVRIIPTSLRGH